MQDRILREREMCEWMGGISAKTAERWRREGSGPPFVRIGSRRIGYKLADLTAWAEARTHASRAAELAANTAASK